MHPSINHSWFPWTQDAQAFTPHLSYSAAVLLWVTDRGFVTSLLFIQGKKNKVNTVWIGRLPTSLTLRGPKQWNLLPFFLLLQNKNPPPRQVTKQGFRPINMNRSWVFLWYYSWNKKSTAMPKRDLWRELLRVFTSGF